MAMNKLAMLSWGVYGGATVTEDQHCNLFASWGFNGSLPAPPVNLAHRMRVYLNTLCMWIGFARTRSV